MAAGVAGVCVYNLYTHSSRRNYERVAEDINIKVSKDINMLMNYWILYFIIYEIIRGLIRGHSRGYELRIIQVSWCAEAPRSIRKLRKLKVIHSIRKYLQKIHNELAYTFDEKLQDKIEFALKL